MPTPSPAPVSPRPRLVTDVVVQPEPQPQPTPVVTPQPPRPADGVSPIRRNFIDAIARVNNQPVNAKTTEEKKPGLWKRIQNAWVARATARVVTRRMRQADGKFFESKKAARASFTVLERPQTFERSQYVFQDTFKKQIQDPALDGFFTKLDAALNSGMADFWMTARKHYGSDREAIRHLAVLFQERGRVGDNIIAILSDPTMSAAHARAAKLGTLCRHLADPALAATLVPPQARNQAGLDPTPWLIAAEQAARLKEQGVSQQASALAPFSLVSARIEDQAKPIAAKPLTAWFRSLFVKEPKSFDPARTADLNELYQTYSGAAFGAGYQGLISYDDFIATYTQAPRAFGKMAFGRVKG